MKVTFVSNYINHHQIPLAEELYSELKEEYCFIETEPMEEERIQMGWNVHTEKLPYLMRYYENEKECQKRINDSDIVVFGGTDEEFYIQERLKQGKIIIRCSERLYKEGQWKAISPKGLRKKYLDHTRYRKAPVYLLCAGAYVPSDFHIVRAYPNKMFQWGYFPPVISYQEELWEKKEKNAVTRILWSGRFIDWKHPDWALDLASCLKKEKVAFEMVLVGGGEKERELKAQLEENGLQDVVKMLGFLKPEDVRQEMEKANIFLFTSDYKEGWGAVLNEAMNSGCAVVANVAAGATPYLIDHGKNGLLYKNKNWKEFVSYVKYLINNPEIRMTMGKNAYETIRQTWNAKKAAQSLLTLCKNVLEQKPMGQDSIGPGSPAKVVSQHKMYDRCVEGKQRKEFFE